jgi:DNA-binding response OmpR family regulator
MPGMNGVETTRLGRLRRPRLPIMFMTGFADTAVLAAETSADLILQKPFYTADLVAKIEEALGSASKRFGNIRPDPTVRNAESPVSGKRKDGSPTAS